MRVSHTRLVSAITGCCTQVRNEIINRGWRCYHRQQRSCKGKGQYVFFPIISLTGKWLQQHGIEGGQVIDVTCHEGKLVITIAKEQRFEGL